MRSDFVSENLGAERKPPMPDLKIEKTQFNLKHTSGDHLPVGWFAISPMWHRPQETPMSKADKRERRGLRGRWYAITSHQATIYRILRFDPKLRFSSKEKSGDLELDWDGRNDLSDYPDGTVVLDIERVGEIWRWLCAWRHPNPTDRLALRISVVLGGLSIVLGLVGFGLGLLALKS